jgi:hypothetical protein
VQVAGEGAASTTAPARGPLCPSGRSHRQRAGCYGPVLLLLLPLAQVSGIEDMEGQHGRTGIVSPEAR